MMNLDSGVREQVVEEKPRFSVALFSLSLMLIIILVSLRPFCSRAQTIKLGNIVYQDADLAVSLFPKSPLQGQAVIVSIRCRHASPVPRELLLLGKKFKIVVLDGGEYKAVCAVPLNAPLGPQQLKIDLTDAAVVKIPLTIEAGNYGEEHLRLPAEMVTPTSAPHLKQIKNDRICLRRIYSSSKAVIRFSHPFIRPLKSTIVTPFGRRRFLNDIPKSPHGGIDLRGKTGTPVPATAGGKVAFSGKLYYSGNAVIIDHGLDVFSLYLHLDTLSVAEGDQVNQGQIVGKLGSTGRVTGPHLHWGIKINGIFVDPLEFINESRLLLQPAGEE
ncbi:MAG: M23 family metallopeptidase [Pseudomonadota bacterium]|nr:M23 family metallopeptidase [Pseudomonadota bacterium]